MGCVMCHGIQGDGNGFLAEGLNPKPRDFTDYKVMSHVPDQSIMDAVNNGILGTAMPSFNLSEEQVADLTAYLRSFLAESYLTVNACLMDTQIVDTKVDTADFKVQVENPDLINVKKDGTLLYITPNLLKAKNKLSSKKVTRTHILLAQNQGTPSESEKYLSLIAVRVHKCYR
jgi:high-affinity iron transporter